MTVALPTPDQLRAVADQCGLALTDEDVASFRGLMQGSVDAYNAVGAMADEVPIVKYPRTPGYRPSPEENTRNAWYRKSTVKGAASGKLYAIGGSRYDGVTWTFLSTVEAYDPSNDRWESSAASDSLCWRA